MAALPRTTPHLHTAVRESLTRAPGHPCRTRPARTVITSTISLRRWFAIASSRVRGREFNQRSTRNAEPIHVVINAWCSLIPLPGICARRCCLGHSQEDHRACAVWWRTAVTGSIMPSQFPENSSSRAPTRSRLKSSGDTTMERDGGHDEPRRHSQPRSDSSRRQRRAGPRHRKGRRTSPRGYCSPSRISSHSTSIQSSMTPESKRQ